MLRFARRRPRAGAAENRSRLSTPRARAFALAVAAVALTWAALPGVAGAFPGPKYLYTGLVDDMVFQSTTPSMQTQWFSNARSIGSKLVRIDVLWNAIAPWTLPQGFQATNPADPNYQWTALDETLRNATAAGETVVLQVGHAPLWAEGANMPSYVMQGAWEPDAQAFGQFARAIATRYSGLFPDPLHPGATLPAVHYFQAWNEPNLARYLMPQWLRASTGAIVNASPGMYRSLLNAFYAGVKAIQPHAFVLAAGTAPYGEPPGVADTMPLAFWRGVFCLSSSLSALPCSNPPHLDALDHHPYGSGPTIHARTPDNVAAPDLYKILRVLHAAQRVHHVLPAGPKSLWVTEIGWSTNPYDPLTAARQARNLSEGFYELWTQGVTHVCWFQIRDPIGKTNSFAGAGLYLQDGTAKLSATAFSFPFVALPGGHGKRAVVLWGRAPVAGRVTIQKLIGGRWQNKVTLRTSAGGIFYAVPWLGYVGQYRAVQGTAVSVPWVNT